MPSKKFASLLAGSSLALSIVLAGCSGDGKTSRPPSYPNVNGNWGITASSSVYQGAITPVGVQLTENNGSVSGIAHLVSACYAITDTVPLTGSEDSSGNLTLTSSAVNNQVLSITGNVSSASSLTGGTYSIAGGCGANDKGTVAGGMVSSISGTYTGTLKSLANNASYPISAALTQSTTVDTNGFEHLAGTATFTGSSCFTAPTIATPTSDSNVIGNVFAANLTEGKNIVQVAGTLSADAKTLTVKYTTTNCKGDYGTGVLTRQ